MCFSLSWSAPQILCLLPTQSSCAANPLQQPFCIHVCESTFRHLNHLLGLLCCKGGSPQLPLADTCQEDECMLLAALSILKLQVSECGPHTLGRGPLEVGVVHTWVCPCLYCHLSALPSVAHGHP